MTIWVAGAIEEAAISIHCGPCCAARVFISREPPSLADTTMAAHTRHHDFAVANRRVQPRATRRASTVVLEDRYEWTLADEKSSFRVLDLDQMLETGLGL